VISNGTAGHGSGILLTARVKGGDAYNNLVTGNEIDGNGPGDVTIHKHYGLSNLSGDLIMNKWIGTDNVSGEPANGLTTGVFVGGDPLSFLPIGSRLIPGANEQRA
jgi:hypothetical protein